MKIKKIILAVIALWMMVPPGFVGAMDVQMRDPQDVRHVQFTSVYKLSSDHTSRVRFTVLLPQTMLNRQEIRSIRYSTEPARIFDENGNRYAEFVLVRPPKDFELKIVVDARLYRYDLSSALLQELAAKSPDMQAWLRPERYIDTGYAEVATIDRTIQGLDELDTIKKLYEYVTGRMQYKGYVPEDVGSTGALERSYGDCSDFSDVLVALARAKGIPARTVDGYLMDYGNDTPRHTWVEMYTTKFGWVPFDPLLGHLGKVKFDRMRPNYIALSGLRNDGRLGGYHFFSCSYSGGSVNIRESYSVTNLEDKNA